MASIERTAYPRFKHKLTDAELTRLYQPSVSERNFARSGARGDSQQLTLLVLLKCHQHLGYLPFLKDIPKQVIIYVRDQLELPEETSIVYEAERSRHRYYQQIRDFLKVQAYSQGGQNIAESAIRQAATTMSDPADLINVAIEKLIEQRFELPSFSTLVRAANSARYQVNSGFFRRVSQSLSDEQIGTINCR